MLNVIPEVGGGGLFGQLLNGALNPLDVAHCGNRGKDSAKLFNLSGKIEGCHSF